MCLRRAVLCVCFFLLHFSQLVTLFKGHAADIRSPSLPKAKAMFYPTNLEPYVCFPEVCLFLLLRPMTRPSSPYLTSRRVCPAGLKCATCSPLAFCLLSSSTVDRCPPAVRGEARRSEAKGKLTKGTGKEFDHHTTTVQGFKPRKESIETEKKGGAA